jgi:hypothetical protein
MLKKSKKNTESQLDKRKGREREKVKRRGSKRLFFEIDGELGVTGEWDVA